MINRSGMQRAVNMLGADHAGLLFRLAVQQDRLENQWLRKTKQLNQDIIKAVIENLKTNGRANIPMEPIIEFVFNHYFHIAGAATDSAEYEIGIILDQPVSLAARKFPKSFRDLRKIYDTYRRTKKLPAGLRDMAKDIKDQYLEKTQNVWRKYSDDFREGNEATQENVLRKVGQAAGAAEGRAKTIVRTETTNYYNQTRRKIYDQSDAITHYLFLAIRDQATTKWCTDKVVGGRRGRHGLVYKKDDAITLLETPACHWNCRSEMVPLTPYNPRHLRLIEDESLYRLNNRCTPLPKGWRANG